jgi:hypothetical protein
MPAAPDFQRLQQAFAPAAPAKLDGACGKEGFPGLDMVCVCAAAHCPDWTHRLHQSSPRLCCRRQVEKECEYLFKAKVGPLHAFCAPSKR